MSALRAAEELAGWLEREFGYVFAQPALAATALTHRSVGCRHNERLEFLGDSVLNCAVARLLFEAHPHADEGALSRQRASLVSGETLAQIAAQRGLGEHLRLGGGEVKSGGFRRASILADALEALLGAVFLDSGFERALDVVRRLIGERLSALPAAAALKDPKTRLQEALQAQGLALPEYTLTAVDGEAHDQSFMVRCEVPALGLAAGGAGASRRRAEQMAADRLFALLPPALRLAP
ncbi:MAG TPA: ribonuclease III [Steroidobacteraceae bacterium]|nr:ribonuclease III [Steroidobacteraceae bacterium]